MAASRTQPRGTCAFCGHQTTKGAMTKHTVTCPELTSRRDRATGKPEDVHRVRVQDA